MEEVINVDEVVTCNISENQEYDDMRPKPKLGSTAALAVLLPHVDGKFTVLPRFDPKTLGGVGMCDASGVLAASGLEQFVQIISTWTDLDVDNVESFILSYSPPERKSSVKGQWVPVTSDSIARVFKLPASGIALSTVRADNTYAVEDCLTANHTFSASDFEIGEVKVEDVTSEWRSWLQLVQVFLQLQPNLSVVDLGTLRTAVAIRRGVVINWALPLSRAIHKCVLQFKAKPVELQCASHISVLVQAFCPQALLKPLAPKKDPESSSSSRPAVVDPLVSQQLVGQFQSWLTTVSNESVTSELENLSFANADLMKQLESSRNQVDRQAEISKKLELELTELKNRLEVTEFEVIRLQIEATILQNKYKILDDDNEQLQRKYFLEKGIRENLEELNRRNEDELQTLRKFYSDFSYRQPSDESEEGTGVSNDAAFLECEMLAQLPKYISFSSFEELQNVLPSTCSLEEAYLWERQSLFIRLGLTYKEFVNKIRFQFLWKKCCLLGLENLFTEVLAWGDVVLENTVEAYFLIGDYGTRILLYYAQLEARMFEASQNSDIAASSQRKVNGHILQMGVFNSMLEWDKITEGNVINSLTEWQHRLIPLQTELLSEAWMIELVKHCQSRSTRGHRIDTHPAAYVKTYQNAKARIQTKLLAKGVLELLQINIHAELVFKIPEVEEKVDTLSGTTPNLAAWMIPPPMSAQALDDFYLGNRDHLFSEISGTVFPTWEAIEWIGKDHTHIVRNPIVPLGVYDQMNKLKRSLVPPISVRFDPRYSPYPRRYSWSSDSKIDSVYYNWPIIPGDFETPDLCVESYTRFSEEHSSHEDPICFRASIFATVLAFWCKDMHMTVDYRVGGRFSTDVYILNFIQFHSCRRIRMLELMCQMQFLRDAHDVMIGDSNEEIGTRRGPCFNSKERHDFFVSNRRHVGAELKTEEAVDVNAYYAEWARVVGKGKCKAEENE